MSKTYRLRSLVENEVWKCKYKPVSIREAVERETHPILGVVFHCMYERLR